MTPENLISEGIKVIERDGWYQGDLYEGAFPGASRTAPVCAMGSLWRALIGTCNVDELAELSPEWREQRKVYCDAVAAAAEKLRATILDATGSDWAKGISLGSVAGFNDDPDTTKEDVLLMMKRAAHE